MGSDRARLSYDERRQWRSVVSQQGRVTLEADVNEASQIAAEEQRREALDFVGPAGTPDDGYALDPGEPGWDQRDFSTGRGTMYVGGVRAFQYDDVQYTKQPEWLDHRGDPDWVDPGEVKTATELIYLSLREQEVSATEDTPLREVALGGPDTAQRTHLVQRVKRLPTTSATCGDLGDAQATWAQQGLRFVPETMRLESSATLRVSLPKTGGGSDPCEPAAQGGYLGADNQLIRVQVVSSDGTKGGKLIWGFDDASSLYRVQVVGEKTLRLEARPPDALHNPREGQAVEVLRTAVRLDTADFIASDRGEIFTLAESYAPDSQDVKLDGNVSGDVSEAAKSDMVFLRVWEQRLDFEAGTAVSLGDTGVDVTLAAGGKPFHPGDFWCIAVRPRTPTEVYPHRLLDAPQPPDGPRLWACPLAIVSFAPTLIIDTDCRVSFDPLTNRRSCCDVILRPEDLGKGHTLQDVVDRHAGREQLTICLKPGVYELEAPLTLGPKSSNLTIEGCHDGVWLQAAAGAEEKFLQGLVVLVQADDVTLRGLSFRLPQVPFANTGGKLAGLTATSTRRLVGAQLKDLTASIGVRPVQCARLRVEDCVFSYSPTADSPAFGAGVFAGGECRGLQVRRTRFVGEEDFLSVGEQPVRMLFGLLLAPSVSLEDQPGGTSQGFVVASLLSDGAVADNHFDGLTGAGLVSADFGDIAIEDNVVRNCFLGFALLSTRGPATLGAIDRLTLTDDGAFAQRELLTTSVQSASNIALVMGLALARAYPLPAELDEKGKLHVPANVDLKVAAEESEVAVTTLLTRARKRPPDEARKTARAETIEISTLPALSQTLLPGRQGLRRIASFGRQITEMQSAAMTETSKEPGLHLSLRFAANDVTTGLDGSPSSAALVVLDDFELDGSALTMSGNVLRSHADDATATIIGVDSCAVAANFMLNAATGRSVSLVIDGAAAGRNGDQTVAVTGNVFDGRVLLPSRSLDSPLDTWDLFNAFT